MAIVSFGYGKSALEFEFEPERFELIGGSSENEALSDIQIGEAFDKPIGSKKLEEIVEPGDSVVIAVPDATRQVGAGQIVNLLVRRLIANGTMPYDISIALATGLHRKVTEKEKEEILTAFIVQRVKVIDHDPTNLMGFVRLGETSAGVPVEINRLAAETDHLILVGGINFHYFAGFTGGRKLVCPGLASRKTVIGTHQLAFDTATRSRAEGVGLGKLFGNPVHSAFVEAASLLKPSFAFNTFTTPNGDVSNLICGEWIESHEAACKSYLQAKTAKIDEKRSLVIVGAGGFPHDINLIQSHKALETASHACEEGGTIVLIAECSEGAGSREFEKFFSIGDREEIGVQISVKYAVGGQTAWSLFEKAERFDIRLVTSFDHEAFRKTSIRTFPTLERALADIPAKKGFILPYGAKFLPVFE